MTDSDNYKSNCIFDIAGVNQFTAKNRSRSGMEASPSQQTLRGSALLLLSTARVQGNQLYAVQDCCYFLLHESNVTNSTQFRTVVTFYCTSPR